MGFGDWVSNIFNPGEALSGGFDPSTQQLSTMTPEQQEYYTQMLEGIQGYEPGQAYTPTAYGGAGYSPTAYRGAGYMPTAYGESQYAEQMQPALTRALSGQAAYEISPETTEQYYQENIYDPAMHEYENVTRPGFLESLGTLHSGARANLEQSSRENLARQLRGERSQLYYADEQARRQAQEAAAQRQMGGLGIAQGLRGQDIGRWQAENQMAQQAGQMGQQQWALENQMAQQANQQGMQQWLAENQQALQGAQFGAQQQALPYQMMLQALGMPTMENVVSQPGTVQGLFGGASNLFQNIF